jgi:hypothetical protein
MACVLLMEALFNFISANAIKAVLGMHQLK